MTCAFMYLTICPPDQYNWFTCLLICSVSMTVTTLLEVYYAICHQLTYVEESQKFALHVILTW